MRMRVTVSALISYDGKYLFVLQDKEGGIYPNTLHIPGGGVKPGERLENALRREVLEETGLELVEITQIDFMDDILQYKGEEWHIIFLRYTATPKDDNARAGTDAKELYWLAKDEISKYEHNPISQSFLRKFGLLDEKAP